VTVRGAATGVAGAVALMAFAGCGESRSTTTGGASGGPAPATVAISETEFKLSPSSPQLKAGPVTIKVKNDGGTTHALVVVGPKGVVRTAALAPGKSATLHADLKNGTYTMFCPIDGHKGMGMTGAIKVGSGAGGSSGGGGRSYGGGGGY
jgi:plastocyanin